MTKYPPMKVPRPALRILDQNVGVKFCASCLAEAAGIQVGEASTLMRSLTVFPGDFLVETAMCSQPSHSRPSSQRTITKVSNDPLASPC